MRRRRFLIGMGAIGAGAAAASSPFCIRRAFGDKVGDREMGVEPRVKQLAAAYERAAKAGQPLLVIVVPSDDRDTYRRGAAWGAYLNFGDEKQLAPLGLVEVVCATMSDLHDLVPQTGKGEPLFFLVETGATPAVARPYDCKLAVIRNEAPYPERLGLEESLPDKHIEQLAGLVQTAVTRDPARAKRLTAEQKTLAAVAMSRWVNRAPTGAHWAKGGGCGTYVEPNPDDKDEARGSGIQCGMAHVPKKAARFLYWYVRS